MTYDEQQHKEYESRMREALAADDFFELFTLIVCNELDKGNYMNFIRRHAAGLRPRFDLIDGTDED